MTDKLNTPLDFDDQPDFRHNHFDGGFDEPLIDPRLPARLGDRYGESLYYLPEAAKNLKHAIQLYPVKTIRSA